MRRVITLDGPAGVGKSTLAGRVAEALGIACLDTGAMFRCIANTLGPEGLRLTGAAMEAALGRLRFSLAGAGKETVLFCNGIPTGREIRTEEVGMLASRYATLPTVRAYLKEAQQKLGASYDLVAEGRDMGTDVFPDAPHKFFLDASPEVRAGRRVGQLAEGGETADLAEVTVRIKERDTRDRNRPIAPLRPADDAVTIDTSALTVDQVFQVIVSRIQAHV